MIRLLILLLAQMSQYHLPRQRGHLGSRVSYDGLPNSVAYRLRLAPPIDLADLGGGRRSGPPRYPRTAWPMFGR